MTTLPSDLTLGTGRSIGRYFGLVSAIPTFLLTGYLALLIATGAWTSRPDFGRALDALGTLSVAGMLAVLAGSLTAAVVLHSLQFTIVQLLEGYWGGNAVMRQFRLRRTAAHIDRYEAAYDMLDRSAETLGEPGIDAVTRHRALIEQAEAEVVIGSYPELSVPDGVMADPAESFLPTRLGNILRRYELRSGVPYELDALSQTTQLALVAQPEHVAYLQDQRSAMDLSARMCASGLMASAATFVLMLPWGVWMLLTVVPYAAAYVAYRGTLVAARHYGDALDAVVALNRFRLYRGLRLHLPTDTHGERQLNKAWNLVRTGDLESSVPYDHTELGDIDAPTTGASPSASTSEE